MKRLKNGLWILFYLFMIDMAINMMFPYPNDPLNIHPTFLQDYFEYGQSMERKLAKMTRRTVDESAPRVNGGWLNSERQESLPKKKSRPDEVLVALYGMSHTQQLWRAIQKTDEKYLIRGFMAAGATPNWTYAAYEVDKGRHEADVAILGIMTEGVSLVTSTTGTTAYFDIGYPYTFPRYREKNEKLIASYPPFMDANGYLEYFFDHSKWGKYRDWLSENDKHYDPILFKKTVFDHSAIARLLRRAYSEHKKGKINGGIYSNGGFNEHSEEVMVLRNIVTNFAESARKEDIIPIIYLVNTQGQGDKLFRVLRPVLEKNQVPYLSTHIICPPDDPRVFLSENSHFTLEKDMELAKEMIKIIEKESERKNRSDVINTPKNPDS